MDHHFEVEDAKTHGVEKAVILYNLRHGFQRDNTEPVSISIAKLLPYMKTHKVKRLLRELEIEGVIDFAGGVL
ncbi:hypothetical protein LCGC14_1962780 [marine sediment metagenome]|uniref:Uncharacterized protein n=1 Tax=marine sediment metagenome TaxID=412755 RepID=A0A0F9IB71_9ZZZZ